MALPSPNAVDKENEEYFDDYFIQIVLSSVEGTLYFWALGLVVIVLSHQVLQLRILRIVLKPVFIFKWNSRVWIRYPIN